MSDSKLLGLRIKQAERELSKLRDEWRKAVVAENKWKVGDLVKVTQKRSSAWGACNKIAIKYGRVRAVVVRYGEVHAEIAPQTKTGFHARTEIHVYGSDTVEKIDSIPEGVQP